MKRTLTEVQRNFLVSVLSAMVVRGGPVSVKEIRGFYGHSDSRVRSHIKSLQRGGFLCCVGKARVKKFVPSSDGVDAVFDLIRNDPRFDDLERYGVGGKCQKPGCERLADDFFRDGYYCRRCMMGHDDDSDMRDIRETHESGWYSKSILGQALDMINPTHGEDMEDL